MFIGGVGAFFHGNAKDMDLNLNTRMAGLPDSALLYCGHEYTVDNLRFAAWLEPDNLEVFFRIRIFPPKPRISRPGSRAAPRRILSAAGASVECSASAVHPLAALPCTGACVPRRHAKCAAPLRAGKPVARVCREALWACVLATLLLPSARRLGRCCPASWLPPPSATRASRRYRPPWVGSGAPTPTSALATIA